MQCYGCNTNKLHLRSKRVFLSKDSLLLCWLIEGGSAGRWRSKGKRSCLTYWRQRNSNAAPIRKKKWPLCISIKGLWTGVTDTDTARGSKDRSVAIDLVLDWYKHTAAREQLVRTPVMLVISQLFFASAIMNYCRTPWAKLSTTHLLVSQGSWTATSQWRCSAENLSCGVEYISTCCANYWRILPNIGRWMTI